MASRRDSSRPPKFFGGTRLNKPARFWYRVSIIVLSVAAIASPFISAKDNTAQPSLADQAFGYGIVVGFFTITIVGIYYLGLKQGKTTFLGALRIIMPKVFWYILFPALIGTVLVVLWAITTHQWAFR